MKVTLQDIAKKVNLTTASVSMILSGKQIERFPTSTIEKVEKCAKDLGYISKKSLKQPSVVLIVCPSVINPYLSTLLQGMEKEADKKGWGTCICNTYWSKDREKAIISFAKSPLVKGVIFAMIPQQPELVETLTQIKPVIVVGDKQSTINLNTVDVNNISGGYKLGEHLIKLGHKKVVYLSTTLNKEHTSRLFRLIGLQNAYKELCPDGKIEVITKEVDYKAEISNVEIEHDIGKTLAKEFLLRKSDSTAIVAINDMIAYGIIDELIASGYKIPEDYSVCGFDNIYPSKFENISLTTVEHFINEKGTTALNLLIEKLAKEDNSHSITHVEFSPELIQRKTTAPPRA